MISIKQKGNFRKTEIFLNHARKTNLKPILEKYGQAGVNALASATPVDTGLTASSWYYEITQEAGKYRIAWKNSNIQNGVPIAIILQYGHGTKNGGFVQGRDYINPVMQNIFDAIAADAWKEVSWR